jgi:hypothetical protein
MSDIHYIREGFHVFEQYSKKNQLQNFRIAFRDFRTLSRQGGRIVAQYDPSSFQIGNMKAATAGQNRFNMQFV